MSRTMKNWLLGILLAAAALLLLLFNAAGEKESSTWVRVSVDGELLRRIDLSQVTESYDFTVETEYGRNVVHVAPGSICVTEADCPDHICVEMGELSQGGLPIVCMPHRLVIEMEQSDVDA